MLEKILSLKINGKTVYEVLAEARFRLQPKKHCLPEVTVVDNYRSPAIHGLLKDLMNSERPCFVGRIGGSDYEIVNAYFNDTGIYRRKRLLEKHVAIASNYNGYFDKNSDPENFTTYLEVLLSCYRSCDLASYGGKNLIDQFNTGCYCLSHSRLFEEILHDKVCFDYTFFEAVTPFLSSLREWGEGKKLLFVSPFSTSIRHQFQRKNELIKDYIFPEFELVTYNTPITYNKPGISGGLSARAVNWHEECARMTAEISAIDFDIALLSCGSYAMPMGRHIKEVVGRKALYLGGILNVVFNIYGQRYDTPTFNDMVNLSCQIDPFENEDIAYLAGGRQLRNESLNAYFGKREMK